LLVTAVALVMAEEMVLTPGGHRPASCVHAIDSYSEYAQHHDDGSLSIFRFKPESNEYFVRDHFPPCASSNGTKGLGLPNGWAAYTVWQAGITMDSYGGYWTVPPTPTDQALQTLFLFTGFQNSFLASGAGVSIIQPVLQWGKSAAGGGAYWAIASWFVSSSNAVYSQILKVAVGDTILGNMTLDAANSKWTISTNDTTLGISTPLTVQTGVAEIDAFVTLEVYGVTSCGDYPNGSDTFTGLYITANGAQVTPNWVVETEPGCSEAVTVLSPSQVKIIF